MPVLECQPLHDDFGARVTGVDLRDLPSAPVIEEILAAIDRYSFLVFPGRPLSDDQHMAFTHAIGEPEINHVVLARTGKPEHFHTVGNVQDDGTKVGAEHERTKFQKGNNLWHSDASFREVPVFISITSAHETPDEGGETLFASGRAAYGRLDDATKAELDPLIGIHDYVYSRSKAAPEAAKKGFPDILPPVRQRLVRRNPNTAEKNLYIGSHVREIEGRTTEASRPLLDGLIEQTTRPEHVHAHAWKTGDLVIWDNRCLIHRGAGYDADKYRRRMRQTRIRGTASTLDE